MAYTKQTWVDGPEGGTPVSAARLGHVEDGIQAAAAVADAAIPATQKGAANGVASLGSDGKIPTLQVPAIAISDYLGAVNSQAAMLALIGEKGDYCTRTDGANLGTWIITGSDPTQLSNWLMLPTPTDNVLSVDGATGVVVLAADGAAGVATKRSLGTGAGQAFPGSGRLDQLAAPTGDVSMGTHQLTNLVDPSTAQAAATKHYVDNAPYATRAPAWSATHAYAAGELVTYSGMLFSAISAFTSGTVFDPTNWTLISDRSAVNAFAAVRKKLDSGLWSVVIVNVGDSTGVGDGTGGTENRYVHRMASALAAAYPTHTVWLRPWNTVGPTYDATVVVQTGSASRTVTDGVLNSTTTMTSATAAFTAADIGRRVVGTGVPVGTVITAVASGTSVTLSAAATATASGVTITVAPLIDICNYSASGQGPVYSQANAFTGIPAGLVPDLFIINHGHNTGTFTEINTRQSMFAMVRDLLKWFNPSASVLVVAQNPQKSPETVAQITAHAQRINWVADLCANEGWDFLNVYQAFYDADPTLAATVKADGIHPVDPDGNVVWFNTLWARWQVAAYAQPTGAPARTNRIVIDGSKLEPVLVVGSGPAKATLNSFWPTMGYTKEASPIAAACELEIPSAWQSVDVWVYWSVADANAGNVVWRIRHAYASRINQDTASGVTASAPSISSGSTATGAAAGGANGESHTKVVTAGGYGLNSSGLTTPNLTRLLTLSIERLCDNGSDTYAGTAYVRKILIERAA